MVLEGGKKKKKKKKKKAEAPLQAERGREARACAGGGAAG